MTIVHKNIISFLLGSSFAYLFVWLIGVVAAMPVPEFLQAYSEFVISYYSNMLIVIFAAVLSLIIMFVVRKAFILFTKQNLFCSANSFILNLSIGIFKLCCSTFNVCSNSNNFNRGVTF